VGYELYSTNVPVIIMFKDQTDQDLIKQHHGEIKSVYHLKPALAASLPQEAIDSLKRDPKIEYIVEDLQIFKMGETLDWGVNRIDADIVHEYNNGTGIKVAILDTGIDYNHPDLAANYAGGYDFGGDYSGAPNDDDPMDYDGHGTHCAGIVAAMMGNDEGVIGVAPEAELYAVKVFSDDGSGRYSDVMEALQWCIDNDIQVISMSFGSSKKSGDPMIESWINAAYNAGILLVGAAGNDGNIFGSGDNVIYPARYENVIAVAATGSNDGRASFSSTGPAVELAAPGVNIYSTYWDNTYATLSGTSMACPMVSGTAALVIASDPTLTNTEVRQRLQVTADDLGALGKDTKYGFGLVDADEAAPPSGPIPNQPPVANAGDDQTVYDVDGNGKEAVTLDGSGSSDLDGSIVSYNWKEGETLLSTDALFTSDFEVGTHTVTLTVTDDDRASASDEVIITVEEAPANSMHVGGITMSAVNNRGRYRATATIVLVDSSGSYVEGATVNGSWSGLYTGDVSGTTDRNGKVTFSTGWIRKHGPIQFCVTDVTKSGWVYDGNANTETCDSVRV
jgi:hypothetical protein